MGKASREAPRGGIATYIGRRADLYRFIAPPSKAARRRNLKGRINLHGGRHSIIAKQSSYIDRYARGRRASAPSPRPSEARLVAQGKASSKAGIDERTQRHLAIAYRLVFNGKISLYDAILQIEEQVPDGPEVQQVIAFLRSSESLIMK